MIKNAFYAQSGGVTSVINVSAQAVIETARKYPKKIGKVYAGRNGIIGALTEDLIDTSKEPIANIKALVDLSPWIGEVFWRDSETLKICSIRTGCCGN